MSKVAGKSLTQTKEEYLREYIAKKEPLNVKFYLENGTKELNNIICSNAPYHNLVFKVKYDNIKIQLKETKHLIAGARHAWMQYMDRKTNYKLLNHDITYPDFKKNKYFLLCYIFNFERYEPGLEYAYIFGTCDIDIDTDIPEVIFTELDYNDFCLS